MDRYAAMWRRCREKGVQDTESLVTLFDSLVRSVLGYCAPVWAPAVYAKVQHLDDLDSHPTALALERLHRRFLRALLGLPSMTQSNLLYLETRRYPLQIFFGRMTVQFAQRLLKLPETDLLRHVVSAATSPLVGGPSPPQRWSDQLAAWSSQLGSPFDVACLRLAPVRAPAGPLPRHRPTRRGPAHARARGQGLPLPSPTCAKTAALACWTRRLQEQLASPTGGTSLPGGRARAARYLQHQPIPSSVLEWTRRPPTFYKSFPTTASRSVVARARLGVAIYGTSVWADPYDPGPRPPPAAANVLPSFTAVHAPFCPPSPHLQQLARHHAVDLDLASDSPFSALLSSPHASLVPFLRALCAELRRVRSGDAAAYRALYPVRPRGLQLDA